MKLTKSEVEHIAMLARLRLTEPEKEKYADQLSSILGYVEKLQNVDTSKAEIISQITGLENIYREDKIEKCSADTRKKILDNAPEKDDDLIKTKSVFN